MQIDVCFTPDDYLASSASVVVVIDVLRATTSIATAFANGCRKLVPAATVAEAVALKQDRFPDALLAGERKGLIIPGFQLGNSPFEYVRNIVDGKTIIMTTTNGTRALNFARNAAAVFTAGFVNATAVCECLANMGRDVVFLCAGTEGRFSIEDVLCAGLLVRCCGLSATLSDKALAARAMYEGVRSELLETVMASSHGRYLREIGFADDVAFCLRHDIFAVVPQYCDGIITIA
ncbi:2-phosphosulfolactate phosphatase [Sporolituus thermophilus]|uniref:Probable 2-phosphosulfolactate phosphatase n=1 Tax=Sporolituus thermophilus DSM 23256 TaxID=1123285 RepID=A0A1G7LDZ2_9FIRM|nr:2-phosphosulfolactate phosphatase [Sporolituus thermophilus]SDF47708.1 2-phosphosulfolactate phosphatase [Sporolituus thermophilus DSM 23256]